LQNITLDRFKQIDLQATTSCS